MQVCKDDGIDMSGSEISAILNSLNCGNSVRVRVATNGPKAWTSPFQSHISNGFYSFGVFSFLKFLVDVINARSVGSKLAILLRKGIQTPSPGNTPIPPISTFVISDTHVKMHIAVAALHSLTIGGALLVSRCKAR